MSTTSVTSDYLNSLEWAVTDEPMPSRVRGITDAEITLANIAATDGRTRKAPIAAENTLRAMSRYLEPNGLKVKYVLHPDGSLRWSVLKKQERTMSEAHIERLRQGAKERAAKNQALRRRLISALLKLDVKMVDGKPTDQATIKALKFEIAKHQS